MKQVTIAVLTLILFTNTSQVYGTNCFGINQMGYFEDVDPLSSWYSNTQTNGTLAISTSDFYEGTASLEAQVTSVSPWQVRMFNNSCIFDLVNGVYYSIDVYLKGDIGKQVTFTLMEGSANLLSESITLTATDWKQYTISILSTATTTAGALRINFTDVGTYYMDNLAIGVTDCSGETAGLATIDACGICSGGNTNIPANATCNLTAEDKSLLTWEGVLEQEEVNGETRNFRFAKDYATTSVSGYYAGNRASSSAGMVLRFATTSPLVNVNFKEDLTYADDIFYHDIALYKNGVFVTNSKEFTISIENPNQDLTEWEFVMPLYTQMNLESIEIVDGHSISTPSISNKPIYVAIGNSITMGVGTTQNGSYLSYPYVVADSLEYELYNWGIGGSKIYSDVLSNFDSGLRPDLITVLWGFNDVYYSSTGDYLTMNSFPEYSLLLDSLCRKFPAAQVMAILPIYTDRAPLSIDKNVDVLKLGQNHIVDSLASIHSNLCFIYGDDYVTNSSFLNDDAHPNDMGYEALAYGIIDKINNPILGLDSEVGTQNYVYPNPTTGMVNLPSKIHYEVYNLSGEKLLEDTGSQANLSLLSPGFYFLKTDEGSFKVLKN